MDTSRKRATAATALVTMSATMLMPPAMAQISQAAAEAKPVISQQVAEAKRFDKPVANCYKAKYRTRADGTVKKINTYDIVKRPRWGICNWLVIQDGMGPPICVSYPKSVCPSAKISRWTRWDHSGAHALGFVPQPNQSKQWTTYSDIYLSEPTKWHAGDGTYWAFNKVTVKPIRVVPVGGL
jgi:hypothetical protein